MVTSNEIRLQVPAMPAYQSTLSEAAHKVTSRKGWPIERVQRFVRLVDLATAALCSSDASSVELTIDQDADILRATLVAMGGTGTIAAAAAQQFDEAAQEHAGSFTVDPANATLAFSLS